MTQMMEQMTIPRLDEPTQESTARGQSKKTLPPNWAVKRLEEVSLVRSGVTKGRNLVGKKVVSVPYMRVANVQDGYFDLSEVKEIEVLESDISKYSLIAGDILLTEGGDPDKLGRGAVWKGQIPDCIHQNHIFCVRPDASILNSQFLSILFGSLYGKDYFLKAAKQTTGIASINSTQLKKFPVLIPPLPEQQRIVARLDKAQQLIDQRKEQLKLMDALVQSLFYEMFGDPVKNEKGWEVKLLSEVCKRITDGTHQSPNWSEAGYPFIFVSNIRNHTIDFVTSKFVDLVEINRLTKGCPIEIDDVLYTVVGSYGYPARVQTTSPFAFQRHIAHLKPEKSKILTIYLEYLLSSPEVLKEVDNRVTGVAQKTLTLSELKNLSLAIPPLSLQQTFADRVQQIEVLKQSMTASLRELEHNFNALMQEAFGG